MRIAFYPLLLAVLAGPPVALAQEPVPRHIAVVGTGEVVTPPDMASVSAGAETEAESAAEALAQNSAVMTAIIDALLAAGIAAADIQTSELGLDPVWEDRDPRAPAAPATTRYRARNVVSIRVRDVATAGDVVDAVAAAGANRIYGISFARADSGALESQALEAAVVDARARAEVLARAAGVTLGPVIAMSERAPGGFQPLARAEMAMDVPVSAGSVTLRAEVDVVFALQ